MAYEKFACKDFVVAPLASIKEFIIHVIRYTELTNPSNVSNDWKVTLVYEIVMVALIKLWRFRYESIE
jgi:hypothetical protein